MECTNGLVKSRLGSCLFSAVVLTGVAQAQTFQVLDASILNGPSQRVVSSFTFPEFTSTTRLTANLNVAALGPNDVDQGNQCCDQRDFFDRAANFYLEDSDGGRIELIKLITGFGGTTNHDRDITDLLPKLSGKTVRIGGWVDTFSSNAWRLTGEIVAEEDPATALTTVFSDAVIAEDNVTRNRFDAAPNNRLSYTVDVPELPASTSSYQRFTLSYFTSGHSGSAGSGGDEFETKTHRFFVNGAEVDGYLADNNQLPGGSDDLTPTLRPTLRPWRNFGTEFRSVNPTTGCGFPGGACSSDFQRSGWKPGDDVRPILVDVTDLIVPGENTFELAIEDVTPNQGNWRISAYLSGDMLTDEVPPPFSGDPADLDGNGVVDIEDIEFFRDAWRTETPEPRLFGFERNHPADFNGDQFVDFTDAFAFRQALGASSTSGLAPLKTPEPSSSLLITTVAICYASRRARRSV